MKKNILLPIASLLILLVGCDYNEEYFEGFDDNAPTDIKKIEYTLTDEDYKAIADNSANKTIAKEKGDSDALARLTTNKYFAEPIDADVYAPAFIASKWFTADNTSAIKLTYNKGLATPEYVSALNGATIYKISSADYESVWGEGSTTNFFTPITSAKANIPTILATAITDAENGNIVAVDYNESENEPSGAVVAVNEDFNIITATVDIVEIEGWQNVITAGTYAWGGRTFSNNGYIQASANNHADGKMEAYMITPLINITSGLNLTFEACYGYYKEEGGRVSILVSSDLANFTPEGIKAATWDDITSSFSIEIPPTGTNYGTLALAGTHNMDKYISKNVYIAFRYDGDSNTGATTTVQIDNIVVKSESTGSGEDIYTATTGLYTYNGTSWSAYSGNGYMVTKSDYTSMGLNYDNFSGTQADHYLPTFLNIKFPYAQDGDIKVATYKYYANSATTIRADEYIFSGGNWARAAKAEVVTSQFVKTDNKWNYDPSITIILKPGRDQPAIAPYYQAIVDAVGKMPEAGTNYFQTSPNPPGYYTNAEFYYGASSYQNNMSFRISDWRTGNAAGAEAYGNLSDTELETLQRERIKEAFIPALEALHSDMAPISGIDVFCTINFGIYAGTTITDCTHQIQYKVTAPGKFEYVDGSFKEL